MSQPPRFNNPAPDPEASAAELLAMREMAASRGLKVIRLLARSSHEGRAQFSTVIEPDDNEQCDVWIWGDQYRIPDEGIIVADPVLNTRADERERRPLGKGRDLYYVGDERHTGEIVAHLSGWASKVADKHLGQMTNDERFKMFSDDFQRRYKEAQAKGQLS